MTTENNNQFKFYLKIIYQRKNKENNITIEDIKQQWEKQNGICPYTGQNLILPLNSQGFCKDSAVIARASLDRIDSSKGYIKDNIQFVSSMANMAKNKYSHEDIIRFCKSISYNYSLIGDNNDIK